MSDNDKFYCYSFRLYHYLYAFGEHCISSNVNQKTDKRYWTFKKSERLDQIIKSYNEIKHKIS